MEAEFERTHPLHPQHPKHPDNHPLRKHHPHHVLLHQITGFFILFTLFAAALLGFATDAPFGVVLLGFAPTVILALVVLALGNADHLEIKYLVLTLLLTLVIAGLAFVQLIPEADFATLLGLNFVLGSLLIILLHQSYAHHHEDLGGDAVQVEAEQRDLSGVFADIEEKAKSLNTSIGRAYSVYKGASAGMREKIKIQHALYSQLDPEKKHAALSDAVKEVEGRLALLEQREKDVFSAAEIKKLGRDGDQRIIDVLADNDGEGVLQTHASARAYAQSALEQL